MTLSHSRNSHERNLERNLEGQSALAGTRALASSDAASAARVGPGGTRGVSGAPHSDVASRLAREAAEREAVRRAAGRD